MEWLIDVDVVVAWSKEWSSNHQTIQFWHTAHFKMYSNSSQIIAFGARKNTRRLEGNTSISNITVNLSSSPSKVSPSAANDLFYRTFHILVSCWHTGTSGTMKRLQLLVVFLVLSVSLMYTAEAARSRTSNQNSFRRAANGIYQTLSSVFGEDNIRGSYKVSLGQVLSLQWFGSTGACSS